MNSLIRFFISTVILAALNPPNAPSGLSGALNGQSSAGVHDEYCTPQGAWIGPASDGPAKMPKACMPTDLANTPSPGVVHGPFTTLSSLQSAINSGACGDVYQVAAGVNLGSGALTLPIKACPDKLHWNTLETVAVSDARFPQQGIRITPCQFGVASQPNRAYVCPAPVNLGFTISAVNSSSSLLAAGSTQWRVIGAHITRVQTGGAAIWSLVDLSSTGAQTNNIILDRVWGDGVEGKFPSTSQSTDTSTTRFLYAGQANHVAVIDSWLTNFYDTSAMSANGNTDAQCFAGGFGGIPNSNWGVYKFVNNHCEASGEGFMMGGSSGPALTPSGCTPLVSCNLDVPADLEVRQNYFFKPPQWDGNTSAGPGGTGWPVVKNGFEMKSGARALFEGNVVENCWYNAQVCYTFSVAGVNQQNNAGTSPTCPTCQITDFTYRYNYGYKAAYGIGLYSYTTSTCPTCVPLGTFNVSMHDNLIGDALSLAPMCPPNGCSAGDATELFAASDPTHTGLAQVNNVSLAHNTFVKAVRGTSSLGSSSAGQFHGLKIQDNIFPYGNYGVLSNPSSAGCSLQNSMYFILTNCAGTTWTADHNAVFGWPAGIALGNTWPTDGNGKGNMFYNSVASVGFAAYGTGDSSFNPANYKLSSTSPLHNAASDGKDLGADINTLLTKIAGVRQ